VIFLLVLTILTTHCNQIRKIGEILVIDCNCCKWFCNCEGAVTT